MSVTLTMPWYRRPGRRERDAAGMARQLSRQLLAAPTPLHGLLEWCRDARVGEGDILALSHGAAEPGEPEEDLGEALEPGRGEAFRTRAFTLRRGGVDLVDCRLWWIPSRLPAHIARDLETASQPLRLLTPALPPARRTLYEAILPHGGHLLEHRAVIPRDGQPRRPAAAVRELYRMDLAPGAG
jgi:hypothetical protein